MASVKDTAKGGKGPMILTIFLGLSTIGLLVSTIVLATRDEKVVTEVINERIVPDPNEMKKVSDFFTKGENSCYKAKLDLPNSDCIHVPGPQDGGNVTLSPPQAGGNVTYGFTGGMDVGDLNGTTASYITTSMCPVNVHWHIGSEHYSVGEYDENGSGPHGGRELDDWAKRKLAEENERAGFRCNHYDKDDEKFTKEYEWKHCIGMEVGETYEVHWPHSAAGACGTVNQYQTPFYDGVFCNLDMDTFLTLATDSLQNIASAVGVQGQVFTVVNDEAYYYPDMMRGMIVDPKMDMGVRMTTYTGSTTGTTRSNTMCSNYSPITWQVDRKCHMISASSFDKLCYEMKNQRDDMEDDLHPHGARELVKTELVANNQKFKGDARGRRHLWADGNNKLHPDEHYEAASRNLREHHDHDHHDHDHHHHEWF